MTNVKYNAGDLTEVATNLYHAFTGTKPDDNIRDRIKAGIEAAVKLYEIDPGLLYVLGNAIIPSMDAQFSKYNLMGTERPSGRLFHGLDELLQLKKKQL